MSQITHCTISWLFKLSEINQFYVRLFCESFVVLHEAIMLLCGIERLRFMSLPEVLNFPWILKTKKKTFNETRPATLLYLT